MNESEFTQIADQLMIDIEEAVDASGTDIDYEGNNGVLTLTMEANGSVVIVSRQTAVAQIWVAARSGGFHFVWQGEHWHCTTTGETLLQLMNRVCTEQAGEAVELVF
ncbi:iron donor protein CyaY [Porticoccus sp. W117]|uniref:iron donor protein CyaY n=1 Tax=Porticoccus sp. W117 TaxID=3054777 RepID=UPI00259A661C|nr:iron donor protein CyaY [Porticoccus sp. W117]MDM3870942.1 iron donor protein CyaY [Porticoccus sp. W117]